jgi:hypothetical protein
VDQRVLCPERAQSVPVSSRSCARGEELPGSPQDPRSCGRAWRRSTTSPLRTEGERVAVG